MPRLNIPSLADGLSDTLGDELNSQIQSLEAEANAALHYLGTWTALLDVKAHDAVLYGGALWEALVDSVNVTPIAGASWRRLSPTPAPSIVTVTGAATIAVTTDVQEVDTASANVQTFPATAPANNFGTIVVNNLQASAGVTWAGDGGTTVAANVPTLTTAGAVVEVYLSGTVWRLKSAS